ncbi:MAG: hypothetical protein ACI9E5_000658 [Candidatus Omnitrophota bacterium]|jgi:hypothetical protein
MGIKSFHIIFIIASICMAFGFSYWAFVQYDSDPSKGYMLSSIISALAGIYLIKYEINFIKKNKDN